MSVANLKLPAWLARLFLPSSKPVAAGHAPFNPDPDYSPDVEDVVRYPPFDRGLPVQSVDRLLESQKTLVAKLVDSNLPYAGETIRNLATFVHLLPATNNEEFRAAGGLLRLCLETGYHSYIGSQGMIFTANDPAERRRELEAKWQLAAFFAGLCCEVGRAISISVVTNESGQQWPLFEPLMTWLSKTGSTRYFLRPPQSQSHRHDSASLSPIIINHIIPTEALQHLTTDDRAIIMTMFETISNIRNSFGGPFTKMVSRTRANVLERDRRTSPHLFGKPTLGMHVEPYLIGAMRFLVDSGAWKINEKLARIHVASDGAFLFWNTAVAELVAHLRDTQGVPGVPTDPRSLAELLVDSGFFVPHGPGDLWWHITPPGSSQVYEVIKLASIGTIVSEDRLASVSVHQSPIAVPRPAVQAAALSASDNPSPTINSSSVPEAPTPSQISTALVIGATSVRTPAQPESSPPAFSVKPSHQATKRLPNPPRAVPRAPQAQPPTDPSSSSSHSEDEVAAPSPAEPSPLETKPATVPFPISSPSTKGAIQAIASMYMVGDPPTVYQTPEGVVVPLRIARDKMNLPMLLKDLRTIDALVASSIPSNTQEPYTHQIQREDGSSFPAWVLRHDVARSLGFQQPQGA